MRRVQVLGLSTLLAAAACSRSFEPPPSKQAPLPLVVSPLSIALAPDATYAFEVRGGTPPYSVAGDGGSALSGEGRFAVLDGGTLTYSPGFHPFTTDQLLIADSAGQLAQATVSVGPGFA